MGSLKELAIPPPKIDLQYSLHFWSYKVMYGCIQVRVPVCVWWQLGKKRFYIRPSQRVSEINMFWFFFAENYITCTSAMKCLVFVEYYYLYVEWGIMTMLVWNIISILYIYVIVLIIIVFTVEMKIFNLAF